MSRLDWNKRSFPELCFIILTNEIEPRSERHGFSVPAPLAGFIASLEYEGTTDRRMTRKLLDAYYSKTLFITADPDSQEIIDIGILKESSKDHK